MASISPRYRAAGIAVAAAALLIGAYSLGAGLSSNPPAQAATTAAPQPPGRITVTGTGTVTGTPDQLVLSMGVQVNAGSVSSALAQANQATNQVTAALQSHGVAKADIQTSGMSISPNYSQGSSVPTGYQVTESLTATLTALNRAGQQIQAAADAGGNAITVNDVSLNLADDGPLLAIARDNAMKDARAKAAQFARAAGQQLGQVISITQASSSSPPLQQSPSASAGSASVPISPGSQQISVSVTVVYAV